MTNQSRVDQSL